MNRARKSKSESEVQLQRIDRDNWEACARLQLADDQRDFLPPALHCIAELQFWPGTRGFVICQDDHIVGLVTLGVEQDSDSWKIFRFLIDTRYQGQGIGTKSMRAILEEIEKSAGNIVPIKLCYHPRNIAAKKLYARFGFEEIELQPCSRNAEGKILAQRDSSLGQRKNQP